MLSHHHIQSTLHVPWFDCQTCTSIQAGQIAVAAFIHPAIWSAEQVASRHALGCQRTCSERCLSSKALQGVVVFAVIRVGLKPHMHKLLLELDAIRVIGLKNIRSVYKPEFAVRGKDFKIFALIHSNFDEVLCLDTDSLPLINPEFPFDTASYQHCWIFAVSLVDALDLRSVSDCNDLVLSLRVYIRCYMRHVCGSTPQDCVCSSLTDIRHSGPSACETSATNGMYPEDTS